MKTQSRRELLGTLRELWEICPNYRFGQMIDNLASLATDGDLEGTYKVEDDELLAAARQHLENRRHALSAVPVNDDSQHDLLFLVEELSEKCPGLRFGQMISNLSVVARVHEHGSAYNVEDDELLAAAKHHLERLKQREADWAALNAEIARLQTTEAVATEQVVG
jgi:hypothetical protein